MSFGFSCLHSDLNHPKNVSKSQKITTTRKMIILKNFVKNFVQFQFFDLILGHRKSGKLKFQFPYHCDPKCLWNWIEIPNVLNFWFFQPSFWVRMSLNTNCVLWSQQGSFQYTISWPGKLHLSLLAKITKSLAADISFWTLKAPQFLEGILS